MEFKPLFNFPNLLPESPGARPNDGQRNPFLVRWCLQIGGGGVFRSSECSLWGSSLQLLLSEKSTAWPDSHNPETRLSIGLYDFIFCYAIDLLGRSLAESWQRYGLASSHVYT